MEYQAGRGTTAMSILGTVLGSIGTAGVLGNGNLLGMGGNACPPCGDNMPVNRYEMGLQQENSELRSQIALRDASIYTDGKLNDLRNYIDAKFGKVDCELRDISVYQATNTATISCMGQQIAGINNVLAQITAVRVPNTALCPGYGTAVVTPPAAAATT